MWSWTWFITLNATQINGSAPQNHCISQLKSLLCLRKERLCGLNEFQWLNVFVCHSGAKSYLMADTQFMAGPPFSQWQVTFVTGKAFSGGGPKIGFYIHEKRSTTAVHEKWNGRKAVDLHTALQLSLGLAIGLSLLTSLCQTGTSLGLGDAFVSLAQEEP